MNITVIGPGRWGSFIAWYLSKLNHNVTMYGRKNSKSLEDLKNTNYFENKVKISCDMNDVLNSDITVISVNSQGFRSLLIELKNAGLKNNKMVLCMKGIEVETGKRLTEIADEILGKDYPVAVWLGPGHVEEFKSGVPNCMVIDSNNQELKETLISEFSSELIRFYLGDDLIGNEIGAAAKNVIGIAAGMLDGLRLSTLKGALMSRGTREIARLIKSVGGKEISAYGLCHLGDYEATVFSKFSHNRAFGEKLVKNEAYDKLAEGYFTVVALIDLAKENNVELPICQSVYAVLYEGKNVKEAISELFSRSLKEEFY
ncbi:MAG: NAD(P)H-dependent glycerol-3-phosphate dehydrogenase [Clostridia bacterium]